MTTRYIAICVQATKRDRRCYAHYGRYNFQSFTTSKGLCACFKTSLHLEVKSIQFLYTRHRKDVFCHLCYFLYNQMRLECRVKVISYINMQIWNQLFFIQSVICSVTYEYEERVLKLVKVVKCVTLVKEMYSFIHFYQSRCFAKSQLTKNVLGYNITVWFG